MPSKLVLLTGGTGHIGFRTLIFALQAGYHIRAAVRSQEKGGALQKNSIIKSLDIPDAALTFVIVPNLEAEGAYDEAVKGVNYVIHVASPIPSNHLGSDPSEAEERFIRPAVQGTIGILKSAKKEPSIRRVIITSSLVALVPPENWRGMEEPAPGTVFTSVGRQPFPTPPYPTIQYSYCASKIASLIATEEWVAKERPSFSVVNVHPGFVFGPDYLLETAESTCKGTNMLVLRLAFGGGDDLPRVGATVHVDDVARVHVGALDEEKVKVKSMRSFITNAPAEWEKVPEIVKRDYKGAVEKGVLKDSGMQATMKLDVDARETEEVFGLKFTPFEEQVKSVLDRYVGLLETA